MRGQSPIMNAGSTLLNAQGHNNEILTTKKQSMHYDTARMSEQNQIYLY